jgi:predicted nucleic acid-binding protein
LFEVSNALLMAERRKRITKDASTVFLEQLQNAPIRIDRDAAIEDVTELARLHQLTVYDAAYLELAIREGAMLATLDKQLAKAARKHKVKLVE